ncbi:MAG: type II secretion system F family protein [Ruthenibacterium sp.]
MFMLLTLIGAAIAIGVYSLCARIFLPVPADKGAASSARLEKFAQRCGLTPKRAAGMRNVLDCAGVNMPCARWWTIRIATFAGFIFVGISTANMATSSTSIAALIVALCALGGLLIPKLYLSHRTSKRQESIERALPDVLDTLVLAAGAGRSLDASIEDVAKTFTGPLSDELARYRREVLFGGQARKRAIIALGQRCDVEPLSVFCAVIAQTLDNGGELEKILSEQAETVRAYRFDALEERANKTPTMMTIPLMFMQLPALLIIMLAPTLVKAAHVFMS